MGNVSNISFYPHTHSALFLPCIVNIFQRFLQEQMTALSQAIYRNIRLLSFFNQSDPEYRFCPTSTPRISRKQPERHQCPSPFLYSESGWMERRHESQSFQLTAPKIDKIRIYPLSLNPNSISYPLVLYPTPFILLQVWRHWPGHAFLKSAC